MQVRIPHIAHNQFEAVSVDFFSANLRISVLSRKLRSEICPPQKEKVMETNGL